MIALPEFENHLAKISKAKWKKLFAFIPVLQGKKKFGSWTSDQPNATLGDQIMPFFLEDEVTSQLFKYIRELQLAPYFDYTSWKEGKKILQTPDYDINSLDTVTLCKLFTVIQRVDRFVGGFLASKLRDRTIEKILIAIEKNIMKGE